MTVTSMNTCASCRSKYWWNVTVNGFTMNVVVYFCVNYVYKYILWSSTDPVLFWVFFYLRQSKEIIYVLTSETKTKNVRKCLEWKHFIFSIHQHIKTYRQNNSSKPRWYMDRWKHVGIKIYKFHARYRYTGPCLRVTGITNALNHQWKLPSAEEMLMHIGRWQYKCFI